MDSFELMRIMFGTRYHDKEPLYNNHEMRLAELFYNVARDEVSLNGCSDDSDTDSVLSFDEKIETARLNFKRVVGLFRRTNRAKKNFLKNFDTWKQMRLESISKLMHIAGAVRGDKFNGCIAKIVGGSVGFVGGAVVAASLLCPPAAAVTVPLAIAGGVTSAMGGGVVAGTAGVEIVLLKNKLDEAKTLVQEEEENFTRMRHWFTHSQELVNAIEDLVGEDLLKDLVEEGKKYFDNLQLLYQENDEKLKSVMKDIMGKICKSGNMVKEFGTDIAPIIISFVLVSCVISSRNRIILDCALLTHHLLLGLASTTDVGVATGRLVTGLVMNGASAAAKVIPGTVGRAVALGAFVALGIALDVLNVVLSSIEIHKGVKSKHVDEIHRVARLLEDEYTFLLNIHDEIRKY
ncbi:uncharacterized protein NPIL_309261 [Nephila pilipes]|uniref:Apolipoprotein L3 n=1 Tax=Nephila pilipes TaxID=299642 RepID=A0A8X6TRK4_NEPPI|nr:uncharacterized protein NPIL_309261 [Nephila pilipes]